jgi:hypothetical protein
MGAFVSSKPVRISLPDVPGEWIEIKAKFSIADRERLQGEVLDVRMDGNTPTVSVRGDKILSSMAGRSLLEIAITGWHLTNDGEDVPYSVAAMVDLDLDDPLVTKVLEEIATRNPFLSGNRARTGSPS